MGAYIDFLEVLISFKNHKRVCVSACAHWWHLSFVQSRHSQQMECLSLSCSFVTSYSMHSVSLVAIGGFGWCEEYCDTFWKTCHSVFVGLLWVILG